jgi:signal peptidase I
MRLMIKPYLVLLLVLLLGSTTRIITSFVGLCMVLIILVSVTVLAIYQGLRSSKPGSTGVGGPTVLRLCFTLAFVLVVGLSFANRRTLFGFDVMLMAVPAMQPTIQKGERFLVDTWVNKKSLPQRGEVVVHSFPGQAGLYVNRVVASGGDSIEIREGMVIVNGQRLEEPYVLPASRTLPESITMAGTKVPIGHYFVVGDNRDASLGDSRFSGAIGHKDVFANVTDIVLSKSWLRIGSKIR